MGSSFRPNRRHSLAAALGLTAALALAAFAGLRSTQLVGTDTPGFFVDPSLNVSLLSLPGWPDTVSFWPKAVTRAAGVAVGGAEQVYAAAREGAAAAPGTPITYETTRLGVAGPDLVTAPRRLSPFDFAVLFAALLGNGLLTLLIAVLVWRNHPRTSAGDAFLGAGSALGVFAITTVAVIADGSLARLNILAQCAAAAGILHLALVFPVDLLPRTRSAALFAVYAPFVALALVYQLTWPDPYGSGLLHGVATIAIGAAALVLVLGLLLRLGSAGAVVVRRRAAIATCGVAGVAAVAASWLAASDADWRAGIAALATCGALLPLAVGAAIAARDFFALDQRLRSILTYAVALPVVAIVYSGGLWLLGGRVVAADAPLALTLPFLAANVALVVAIAPLIRVVRRGIDRWFSPETYSVDRSLENLKRGLSAARTTQTLIGNTVDVLRRTLHPTRLTVYLRARGAGFPVYAHDDADERRIAVPAELADLLDADEIAFRHQLDDGPRLDPQLFDRFRADLLVPISRAGSSVGVIALAGKESGHPYDGRDIAFVRAAAGQIALALPNAAAQDRVEVLHRTLEELTENLRLQINRTAALEETNGELADALAQLRDTHHQLGQDHQAVLRAERLGALERLSLALTQELSGPLAAVLVALRGIGRLGKQHADAIPTPERQRQVIEQMMAHAENGAAWIERTVSYLRSFQALTAGAGGSSNERFAVRDAFTEALSLLRPRLRESGCTAEYSESPEALELYGSRQRFVMVLAELIGGSVQAYQQSHIAAGRISVEAELTAQGVCVSVVDWANGLASAAIPQLLDQLGSDELVGNRRGLWIARNLVEEGFGGSLEGTTDGERTCFTAVLPHRFGKRGPMAPAPSLRLAAND